MSKPLTREQVNELLTCMSYPETDIEHYTKFYNELMAHDAALRQQLAAVTDEVRHYREAAASVGETDGHGWAETTKELRQQLAEATERAEAAETSVAFDKVTRLMTRNQALRQQLADARAEVARLKETDHAL